MTLLCFQRNQLFGKNNLLNHENIIINDKYINHKETLYKTMKDVFIKTNKDLCRSPFIDTQFSGSTCVTIILTKNEIISGNAGDSRAVMGRCKNGEWLSIELTQEKHIKIKIKKYKIKKPNCFLKKNLNSEL